MKVELQLAWAWTCPQCGTRNFHEGEKVNPSDDEARAAMHLDAWQEVPDGADFMAQPASVECRPCGWLFEVEAEEIVE